LLDGYCWRSLGRPLFAFALFEIGKGQHKHYPSQQNNYSSPRAKESNQERASNGAEEEKSDSDDFLGSAEKHSGVFLVLVTALLALMTGFLWDATKKLVKSSERIGKRQVTEMEKSADAAAKAAKVADDTLKLTQRAVLSVDTVFVEEGSRLIVKLQNVGRTTARNVISTTWWKAPRPNETPQPPGIKSGPPITIGIGVSLPVWVGRETDIKPYWDDIQKKARLLYFRVEVTYDDIFGANHQLVSDGWYDPATGRFNLTRYESD
jgi:hypothetical protein